MKNNPYNLIAKWDSRNGRDSYPFPHNATHGWQICPKCKEILMTMEIECDYYSSQETCKCGAIVALYGIKDVARFSGLEDVIRKAEGDDPIQIGEIPYNASEWVKSEFMAIAAHGY